MLACPIPESRGVTIADLNHAIHLPVINSPNLVAFLAACTQCRQCVPACPADLSRADMVLFNKMKIEDAVPDQFLWLQQGYYTVPSGYTLDGLAQQLTQLRLFAGVAATDLRRMLLKATLRQLVPGELLCREGEFHERLYIVLQGSLEQSSTGYGGYRIPILRLGPGAFFGEMAIMADQPEPFDVIALEPAAVLEIPKAAAHRLMSQSPQFSDTINDLYTRRALWTYARKPTVLGGLSEQAIAELFDGAELRLVKAGQTIFKEGARPEDVYLVRSGFLRVSRAVPSPGGGPPTDLVLVYFREGDVFGLLPLLFSETSQAFTVSAASRSEVIQIKGAKVQQVLAKYPEARGLLGKKAMEIESAARAQGQAAVPEKASAQMGTMALPLSWDVLVAQGVAQGREVLVIDQNRCTYCNNCVDACERRHGASRLQLRGLQVENLMFPAACRHCEDPVCLLCSVNGIVRLPGGEITIVDDNCIGCGACAERCPYGNINMQPAQPPKRSIFDGLRSMLGLPGKRAAASAELDAKVPKKAVKCDLCAGYNDYACVTACPTGAAFRIDPKSISSQGAPLGLSKRTY
jgi:CRP-like cAMP-binding protein/Fe-S-cluster-containing hydrogenase component 2